MRFVPLAFGAMYSIVALNIHNAQLGKVGKYQRGILGTVAVCLFVFCLFDGVQQHFSYIVAGSFIGGGNRRTRRKPPICRKSLTNFITSCCTPSPDRVSNSQTSVVIGTDYIGNCRSHYHTIMTTTGRNVTIQWQASEQTD
jgi:hypothetical protein